MTEAEATVLEVIKWAVSAARPAPEIDALDEDMLIRMAVHHRVLGQLLSRLSAARPLWFPARLLTQLRIAQHRSRLAVQAKITAAQEISRAMQTRGLAPPIFVKGFAAYALTAQDDLMYPSGDMDIFAEDLPALETVLHELGYTGKRKHTHEWAKLSRGETTLDIHEYFPSLSYPDSSLTLTEGADFYETQIRWEHLAEKAVPGIAPGADELLFPSPVHLWVIHCAHCFRSCMTRLHYMDRFGGFRLYELLSISALARLPNLNLDCLTALIEQFSAQDAVRLVNTLAKTALGREALLEYSCPASSPAIFPERLFYGGWVSLQAPEDWLRMRGIDQIVEQLGSNTLSAHCSFSMSELPHVLSYGPSIWDSQRLKIDWDEVEETLTVVWSTGWTTDQAGYEMLIHFGDASTVRVSLDTTTESVAVVQKSEYVYSNQQATVAMIDSVGPALHLICPVPRIPRSSAAPPGSLPLFLAVRRLNSNGISTEVASYLPLQLVTT